MPSDGELHSRDQVWRAISDVSQQQAATEARIGALETAVETGFSTLQHAIERISIRQTEPFPVWNLISAVGVVAVILAGYATLITTPLDSRSLVNAQTLETLLQRQEELHMRDAQRIAALEIQVKELRGDLDDVDKWGSRRWGVESRPQP